MRFLVAIFLLLLGCSNSPTKPNSELEKKINAEAPANTADEIAQRGAHAFINAPGITDEQKQKLLDVFIRTYDGAMAIRADIGKSKSLMFKLVSSKDMKSKEVEDLRKHIVALDQKRLDMMFKALADVQAIVGTGKEKEEIYKHFYDFEYPHAVFSKR